MLDLVTYFKLGQKYRRLTLEMIPYASDSDHISLNFSEQLFWQKVFKISYFPPRLSSTIRLVISLRPRDKSDLKWITAYKWHTESYSLSLFWQLIKKLIHTREIMSDHVGELIFFLRGNKVENRPNVERTRRKMKVRLVERCQDQRKRSVSKTKILIYFE